MSDDVAVKYGSAEHAAEEALEALAVEGWITDTPTNVAATVIAGLRERGFTVSNEPRCECGWKGNGNHMHDMRMGRKDTA